MALRMSDPWKHPKTGIFWFRKAVPAELRALVGKREELRTLATRDIEQARRSNALVLAQIESKWANLRQGSKPLTEREAHVLAQIFHDNWLAWHRDHPSEQYLWEPSLYRQLWTRRVPTYEERAELTEIAIEDMQVGSMRRLCFQQADICLRNYGLVVDADGRPTLAKAIGAALQRASIKLARLAEGYQIPETSAPAAPTSATDTLQAIVSNDQITRDNQKSSEMLQKICISELLNAWWQEAERVGRKPSTYESYRHTIANFIHFLKHDSASQVSAEDVIAFKDFRLKTPSRRTGKVPSARTIKDCDLAALKTVFGWAVSNRKLAQNPATGVTIKLAKPRKVRTKSFTEAEALALLSATLRYEALQETSRVAAAKRWVPWLCAFTGARVGEIAQLRRQDVRFQDPFWIITITPDAGTQKTNEAREVILHPQIVESGFPAFVQKSAEGPLFLKAATNGDVLGPLQGTKNRLAEFARTIVADPNVAPNHGWRHRFKTVGMEAGIPPRILDAIQGQAAASVADNYGEVTLKTMAAAISKLPRVVVDGVDGSTP